MDTIKCIIKEFKENFNEDFVMEEAEIWLESEMEVLIKNLIPKKISDIATGREINNFSRKLDKNEKQNIRAKNYGWNLCIKEMEETIKSMLI